MRIILLTVLFFGFKILGGVGHSPQEGIETETITSSKQVSLRYDPRREMYYFQDPALNRKTKRPRAFTNF